MSGQSELQPASDLGNDYQEVLDRQSGRNGSGKGSDDGAPHGPLRIVEALLFIGGPPLTLVKANEIGRGMTADQFNESIDTLNRTYRLQGRPYTLQTQGEGFVL